MPLTLTSRELEALRHALDNYLPELRYELARVKLERYRHDLVTLEETLTALRQRLEQEREAAAPSGAP